MGKRGRYNTAYDARPVQRLRLDDDAVQRARVKISERLQRTLEELAEELAVDGIHEAAADLFVAQETVAAVEFYRWLKAGQARGRGLPARGLMDAMGYSSQTSLYRFLDTIDLIAGEQAKASAEGRPRELTDSNGYTYTVRPTPDAMTVAMAKRRGYISSSSTA